MDINNLTGVYNQNPTLQGQYTLQQYLDLFGQGSTPPPSTIPPTDPNAPTTPLNPGQGIINAGINQYQGNGGDDRYRGGGAFGNLDISDVKTFQKDVYNSKTGKFEQQTVTGYKNPTLGGYQTFKGKNINHGGIAFKGIAGMAIDAMGFGPEVDENGYYDGQISGTFTGFKPGDFLKPSQFFKAKKNRQTFMDNNKIEIDRVKKEKLMEDIRKMEANKKAAEQQALNNAYVAQTKTQREAGGSGGGQFDGASSKSSYDEDPTSYSGSFKKGGSVRKYFKGGIVSLRGR